MTNPTHHPLLVLIALLATLGYAVWAMHNRNDRRALPSDLTSMVHGMIGFAVAIMIFATAMAWLSDGRRFLAVRQVFEVGYLAGCLGLAMVVRILKGQPHDRKDRETRQ